MTPPSNEDRARSRSGETSTLADVQILIEERCAGLRDHPLLRRLEGRGSFLEAQCIARGIAFFVLGFQDVTRLIGSTIVQPELAALARATHLDDRGHELWFLEDLELLDVELDVPWLFSDSHLRARDATYSQIADVLRSKYDTSRFAIGIALEEMAEIFFGRMISYLDRVGSSIDLKYFGRHHQEVEQAHEVFQTDAQNRLKSVTICGEAWKEIEVVLDRTVVGVEAMATEIEIALAREA